MLNAKAIADMINHMPTCQRFLFIDHTLAFGKNSRLYLYSNPAADYSIESQSHSTVYYLYVLYSYSTDIFVPVIQIFTYPAKMSKRYILKYMWQKILILYFLIFIYGRNIFFIMFMFTSFMFFFIKDTKAGTKNIYLLQIF